MTGKQPSAHADAAHNHAVGRTHHHPADAGGQVGVAVVADGAAPFPQLFAVGAGVHSHNGGGVRLAEGVAAGVEPHVVHLGVGHRVAGVVHHGNRHRHSAGLGDFGDDCGHGGLGLVKGYEGFEGH